MIRGTKRYRKGDYLVQTDDTGAIVHRSDCKIQYDGKMVLKKNFEYRHPQERPRTVKDDQSVPNPRPISPEVYKFSTDYTVL